jgi:hypothetical protein
MVTPEIRILSRVRSTLTLIMMKNNLRLQTLLHFKCQNLFGPLNSASLLNKAKFIDKDR